VTISQEPLRRFFLNLVEISAKIKGVLSTNFRLKKAPCIARISKKKLMKMQFGVTGFSNELAKKIV
jgi:hypothetical protein